MQGDRIATFPRGARVTTWVFGGAAEIRQISDDEIAGINHVDIATHDDLSGFGLGTAGRDFVVERRQTNKVVLRTAGLLRLANLEGVVKENVRTGQIDFSHNITSFGDG